MISYSQRQNTVILTIALSLLLTTALACGQSSNIAPTPTNTSPSFEDRILLLQGGGPYKLLVVELISGAETPKVLWSDLPGSFTDRTNDFFTISPLVSPDGRYAVLPGSLALTDLSSGQYADIPLPDDLRNAMREARNQRDFQPAFSPDGRYLAYALRGTEQRLFAQSGLYLLELSSDTITTLFEGPCAAYQGTICGSVSGPIWLDETTLAFNSFAGELPREVTFPGMSEIQPNHTTIMTVEGDILHEFDQSLGMYSRGQTTIIYSDSGATWLEANDFKQGVISGTPLDAGARIELSPDGRFAYYVEQGKLVELRTDSTKTVAAYSGQVHLRWSPDNRQIAAWNEMNNELHITSLNDTPSQLLMDLDDVSDRSSWWLLGWVP